MLGMGKTPCNGYSDNCCAYGSYYLCFMMVKQKCKKKCLQKQCHDLIKETDHTYWKQRANTHQKRKARKTHMDQYKAAINGLAAVLDYFRF